MRAWHLMFGRPGGASDRRRIGSGSAHGACPGLHPHTITLGPCLGADRLTGQHTGVRRRPDDHVLVVLCTLEHTLDAAQGETEVAPESEGQEPLADPPGGEVDLDG